MKYIKHYLGNDYAVYCSSKEQWNQIIDLIREEIDEGIVTTLPYHKIKTNYLNLNHISHAIGVGNKQDYKYYTILNASEFLNIAYEIY